MLADTVLRYVDGVLYETNTRAHLGLCSLSIYDLYQNVPGIKLLMFSGAVILFPVIPDLEFISLPATRILPHNVLYMNLYFTLPAPDYSAAAIEQLRPPTD